MLTHLVIAGVRGGVGTTTVAALSCALLQTLGAQAAPADHNEGILASRLPVSGASSPSGFVLGVLDAGRFLPSTVELLSTPTTGVILVGSGDPESWAAFSGVQESLAQTPYHVLDRVRFVQVNVRNSRAIRPVRQSVDALLLPFERSLATWGPVSLPSLASGGRLTAEPLNRMLQGLIASGGVAGQF